MERGQERKSRAASPITVRSVAIGAAAVALLALINPHTAFISRTWSVGYGSLLGGSVVVLFLLVAANGLSLRLFPGVALTRSELLVVYGMLMVSLGLAVEGGIPYVVSATTFPFYLAGPANDWQHLVWPNIPAWLQLSDARAYTWFWEGLPQNAAIPWGAWAGPMMAWGAFALALLTASFCLGALFRRDWIERQRLTFPLVEVSLSIAGDKDRPTLGTAFFRDWVFWIGLAVTASYLVALWLHVVFPNVPALPLRDWPIGGYFRGMGLPWSVLSDVFASLNFPVFGISCLLPGEVSLSLWLFYVLSQVQLLAWGAFGIAEDGGTAASTINAHSFIGFQEIGGFIALSMVLLYHSRKTVKAALMQLARRERAGADPYQPLTEGWALLGFVAATVFMLCWALKAGMSWWSFAGLLAVFYAVLIGASRLVAAGGVMFVDTSIFPRGVMTHLFGSARIGAPSLTMYSYLSVIFMYDPMNFAMPQMMNSFRLLHAGRVESRRWPLAAALAIVTMMAVGVPALIATVCRHGAATLGVWPFFSYPEWAFGELDSALRSPIPPNNYMRFALVVGGVFTLGLTWLHSSFLWWPISPIGFLIGSSAAANWEMWFSVFLAWALTTAIRRYGGLKLYRQVRPAFLGIVLGKYLTDTGLAGLSALFGVRQTLTGV